MKGIFTSKPILGMSIKTAFVATFLLCVGAINISAQTDCPVDKVCITVAQARQALANEDTIKAQAAEIDKQKQLVQDALKESDKIKIELAKTVGELTGAQQMNVRLTAIVDVLLKHVKPKKIGLINF